MAQTLVDMLSHVVFSTKHRERSIPAAIEPQLYRYMSGIVRDLQSRCVAINGTADHIHLLISLSKNITLSALMCQVKGSSAKWLKAQDRRAFRAFGWQDGYGAFSVSRSIAPRVVDYIARQKQRHQRMTFEEEYRLLVRKAEVEFDEQYLFD
jgi:putative transposase